ncbi:MAG: cyclic nucleotide-binding domain-containing protein [Acidobacteriota bacterium]
MASLSRIERVVHLQSVDLFAHCSAEHMVRMASIASERRLRPGDRLWAANDPAENLVCLVDGSVRLEGSAGVRHLEAPATLGAREILADEPRADEVVASRDTVALIFDGDDLFDLLSNDIEIVKALFRQLLGNDAPRERPGG